jgi:hypothetical protein
MWLFKEWANVVRLKEDGIPVVGFTWYSLTDQIDWDSALRDDAGRVNACGLYDLDRKMRRGARVSEAHRRLAGLPAHAQQLAPRRPVINGIRWAALLNRQAVPTMASRLANRGVHPRSAFARADDATKERWVAGTARAADGGDPMARHAARGLDHLPHRVAGAFPRL